MQPRRLTFAAPVRCSHEIPYGGFTLKAWTQADVEAYIKEGGWFVKGRHVFADRAAAKAAGVGND